MLTRSFKTKRREYRDVQMPFCGEFGHVGMRFHVEFMLFKFLRRICSILW